MIEMFTVINVAFLHITLIHVPSFAFETLLIVLLPVDLPLVQLEQRIVLMVNVVSLATLPLSPHALALEPLHWLDLFTLVVLIIFSVPTLKTLIQTIKQIKALLLALKLPILRTFLSGHPIQDLPCGANALSLIMAN
jgi:hypothetical protein